MNESKRRIMLFMRTEKWHFGQFRYHFMHGSVVYSEDVSHADFVGFLYQCVGQKLILLMRIVEHIVGLGRF